MSFLYTNLCSNSFKTAKCTNMGRLYRAKLLKNIFGATHTSTRHLSQALAEGDEGRKEAFVPFNEVMKIRKSEARNSILVQVQSSYSYKELHSFCSTVGTVKQMFHYSAGVEPMHFIIVEFTKESDVHNALATSAHVNDAQAVPISSQFLWFRAPSRKLAKLKQSKSAKLIVENGTKIFKETEIKELLHSASDMSDQMYKLHEATKLSDLGTRLRFLVARQVEEAISGMFPSAAAYPFGSSVNGCGKMGCDLDLVLRLNDNKISEESRLVFHCKATSGSERSISQRHMEAIGDMIQLFLPGCAQVRRILQARVPIIKYYQQLADVECDLSMSNMSGVHMSDLLYIMSSIDPRVRPLVFTVRKWAQEVGLTNCSPGRWITNFSLTLLVLAFLQNPGTSPPLLPTLNSLVRQAEPQDKFVTDEGVNCTFLRDVTKLPQKHLNTDDLKSLLLQFFEYYSHFDFDAKAVCLNEGVPIAKPEHSALYIVNPLERGLNVSKNVSLEELEKFKLEVRDAAWTLESQENRPANWGVLALFDNKKTASSHNFYMPVRPGKLLQVSKLFEAETGPQTEFKDGSLKRQVEAIKKDTESKLKKLSDSDVDKQNTISKRKSRR